MKPIRRRPAAVEDMFRQVTYRRGVAGEASAATLVDEMQECLRAIAEAPAIGSRCIGQLLGIPDEDRPAVAIAGRDGNLRPLCLACVVRVPDARVRNMPARAERVALDLSD